MLDKKQVLSQIATYTKRREEYKKYVKNTTFKLEKLKKKLKFQIEKETKLRELVFKSKSFFGEDLFSSVKKVMYVDYFCKFAVENGFKATEIGKIINRNRNTVVYRRQKCLVYLKDDINRALWQDYKKFMTT